MTFDHSLQAAYTCIIYTPTQKYRTVGLKNAKHEGKNVSDQPFGGNNGPNFCDICRYVIKDDSECAKHYPNWVYNRPFS